RSGAGGAKGGDQGECGSAKHVPDTEPGKRATSAGTHTESGSHPLCRHIPEVGAGCGKAARPDLCGGRAMKRTSLPLQRRNFIAGLVGSAAMSPLAARAQQTMPVIGFLGAATAKGWAPNVAVFLKGLREAGYTDGA